MSESYPRVGSLIAGRYELQQLLGEGERKQTFLAEDQKLSRRVAISVVRPEAALTDPEGAEREARVLGRIGEHDNIVSLYDFDVTYDRLQYMVFEYLEGGTLAARLRDDGPPRFDDLLRLARQLCRGLSHLHSRGVVHRDLSPSNVWLDERSVAHIGDFDSAIGMDQLEGIPPLTTNAFAAPEERRGEPLDQRSDLYSLGALLYLAATSSEQLDDPTTIGAVRPDLPSSFGHVVERLLAESPEDRPKDANAVLKLLDEVRHASRVDDLIARGECDTVEFKSSLRHGYGSLPPRVQTDLDNGEITERKVAADIERALSHAVTKTVAAFLNSDGGTLLIGVSDSGAILGIEADLPYLSEGKQNLDWWQHTLRDKITNALGAEVWAGVQVALVRQGPGTVAVVSCQRRDSETWHHMKGDQERFYVRIANTTEELSGAALSKYLRERWKGDEVALGTLY